MNSGKKKISIELNPLFIGLKTNEQKNQINTPNSKQ